MKPIEIAYRADGGADIGFGHLMRVKALADILGRERGLFKHTLVTKTDSSNLTEELKRCFNSIVLIDDEEDDFKNCKKLNRIAFDSIVLDGYDLTLDYQKQLTFLDTTTYLVSDYPSKTAVDVVISPNGGLNPLEYEAQDSTQFYLGAEYAPIQKTFLNTLRCDKQNEVFICFGGSDPADYTRKIIRNLSDYPLKLSIVVGKLYKYTDELKKELKSANIQSEVYSNISAEQMKVLMCRAEVGITSASTIAYEFLSQNHKLFILQTADNQKNFYSYLVKSKLAKPFTIEQFSNLSHVTFKRTALFNSLLIKRIQWVFLKDAIKVRRVVENDSKLILEWANDPYIREQSYNSDPISLSEHSSWFEKQVQSADVLFLVFELKGKPFGQVRYTIEQETATINYSISKDFRGLGLAYFMVKKSIESLRINSNKVSNILAFVKKTNIASNKIFIQLNFEQKELGSSNSNCFYLKI